MDSNLEFDAARAFAGQEHNHFIGGEWQPGASAGKIDSIDPGSGTVIGQIAAGNAEDVDHAVDAARAAFPAWSATGGIQRAKLMWALADALMANASALAMLESLDNGMPARMAGFGVMGAAENLRYNAGWAGKLAGETVSMSAPDHQAFTIREPVGVVGAIVPWNFPLAMAVAKLAPILAAGCTVVLKPAELTSMSALKLAELIAEVGFPAGVINVVTGHGAEAGQALVDHPGVAKIAFTGSTATGKGLLASAAGNLKRLSLELGGKSPTVIFADANLAAAAEGAAMSVFMNSGQVCVAGSRVLIQRSVFDQVIEAIVARARAIRVGSGQAPDTEIGPLISGQHRDRVLGYVEAGRSEGAEVLAGGKVRQGEGFFMEPTVFVNARPEHRIMREEIFGPVVAAVPFDDAEEAIAMANDTEYGLSASVWSREIGTALGAARKIDAGTVRVNGGAGLDPAMPFGGFKQSGWGRENGREGVLAFTETKSISIKL
ncbi:aldehyde dehydrogenase family protein [Novosphingobium pentaromativorans]|uniref:Aldehyde dehydrogenase (NAD+) n=1 Tax=Novosphingobium pentaromativorans US6-1 TaxID=1088721 RepID=G6EB68_9SPHN|nr:aldehyde dehydrogenase family protein [Novosphingobium pentaromativorans]AIT80482.1 betaine-aldehyde dehydrogenase [Novosphingobium pentaromativorans US6-1]EHJ61427.1 Aldehyde dehydrogenase (NAD+) [Novosphingobium pentaromativorans US6-1]